MNANQRLVPIEVIKNPIIANYAQDAGELLKTLPWCKEVRHGHLAFAIPELFAVFVIQVVPRLKVIPGTVWVVVFHEPRACFVQDKASKWQDALDDFISEMRWWIRSHPADTSAPGLEDRLDAVRKSQQAWFAGIMSFHSFS
jgi:hypothetical protein